MAIKALVLYVLARLNGTATAPRSIWPHLQGGEFAFVLFGVAVDGGILEQSVADTLVVVVSLSMVVTPAGDAEREMPQDRPRGSRAEKVRRNRAARTPRHHRRIWTIRSDDRPYPAHEEIPFTALEASFEQVDFVRNFGNKIYFGDASRLDLLRAANADLAEIFVLAIDDIEASVRPPKW